MLVLQSPDAIRWFGMRVTSWALLLFMGVSLIGLIPLIIRSIAHTLNQTDWTREDLEQFLLGAGWVTVTYFFFSVRMHERYVFTALLFLAAYAILSRDFLIYIVFSIANFLNLESVFHSFGLDQYTPVLLDQSFAVALLYLLVLVLGLYRLYSRAAVRQDLRVIGEGVRTIGVWGFKPRPQLNSQ